MQTHQAMAIVSVKHKCWDFAFLPLVPLCIRHRCLKPLATYILRYFLKTQRNYVIITSWTVKDKCLSKFYFLHVWESEYVVDMCAGIPFQSFKKYRFLPQKIFQGHIANNDMASLKKDIFSAVKLAGTPLKLKHTLRTRASQYYEDFWVLDGKLHLK